MAIGKIKASRVNTVDAPTYVGEEGILFYNFANGVIRLSDGITPGGVPIPYNIASNVTVGGIKAGPGVVIDNTGVLRIDSANLSLSFGNFTANNNILSITNSNENMILSTNGTAEIQLTGNVGFYKPDGYPPNVANLFARFNKDGQSTFYVPTVDATAGAMQVVGSTSGNIFSPINSGVMLHITGQQTIPSRFYNDGINEFGAFVGRRLNGNIASPTPVLSGQDIMRISATGHNGNTIPGTASSRITFQAAENFTTSNFGGNLILSVVPVGSTTLANKAWVTGTGLTVDGNISGGNLSVTGTVFGHYTHELRDAGVIADGGTVTINFITDDIVKCIWGNGLTVAYSNFIPGRGVRLIATKLSGTGTDTLSLGTISANNTSTGSTTISGSADVTYIIEFYSTSTTVAGLYAKL